MTIKETCLYVKNVPRSAKFYSWLLAANPIGFDKDRHVFFRLGKSVLLCFNAKATKKEGILPAHGSFGPTHLAFEVSRRKYLAEKRRIGRKTKILHEHQWGPRTRCFYFRDPDGNLLEMIEPGFWESMKPAKIG